MKKRIWAFLLSFIMITTCISLPASAENEPADVAGLETAKSATPIYDDGNLTGYKLNIEAYTKGEVIHATTGNKVDIILILDMSKQMQTGNRLDEMKIAATSFIDSSITTDGSRRIALVTYNDTATVRSGSQTDNDAALVPITEGSAATMISQVENLTGPAGASNIDQGMMKAAHIFQDGNSKVPADRQRLVVLLSAGVFGSGNLMQVEGKGHFDRIDIRKANRADLNVGQRGLWIGNIIKTPRGENAPIDEAAYFESDVKINDTGEFTKCDSFKKFFGNNFSGCGAEMYCIGVGMPKADMNSYGGFYNNYYQQGNGNNNGFWKNYGILGTMINEVMYRMSSHRPDSTHVGANQYNSWEIDWQTNLMKTVDWKSWPSGVPGFWEGHYWDNYTRNLSDRGYTDISYFITTDDASDLSGIFNTINQNIGQLTSSLESTTVLKDIVTPYFTMPEIPAGENVKSVVKVYTMDYNGTSFVENTKTEITNDVTVEMDRANRTVTVTGYKFDDNYITNEGRGDNNAFFGKKMIIEFIITPNEDFLGGNNILTNEAESGVYTADGKLLEKFPKPDVDVPVKVITPESKDGNIYLGEEANIPHITNVGGFVYGENDTKTTVDGINNKFVNIKYTISDEVFDEDGNTSGETLEYVLPAGSQYTEDNSGIVWDGQLAKNPLLKEDTTYYIKAEVVPTTEGTSKKTIATDNKKINVYMPHITFRDSSMNFGQTANYDGSDSTNPVTKNYVNTIWKHGEIEADAGTMGPAPTLTFTYSPAQGAFEQDTPVKITKVVPTEASNAANLKHNVPAGQDLIKYVTFYREDCTFDGCEWGKEHNESTIVKHVNATTGTLNNEYENFVVHLNRFDLTLHKTGAQAIDENQTFVFRITGPKDLSMDVTIVGNSSVTIKDLLVGDYTIEELDDWSWRYEPEVGIQNIKPEDVLNGEASVTFKNSRDEDKWLSGDSYCENWFHKINGLFN